MRGLMGRRGRGESEPRRGRRSGRREEGGRGEQKVGGVRLSAGSVRVSLWVGGGSVWALRSRLTASAAHLDPLAPSLGMKGLRHVAQPLARFFLFPAGRAELHRAAVSVSPETWLCRAPASSGSLSAWP